MKYRTLGKTGWSVSAVSMGCWGLGGQWGPVDETMAVATVHAALAEGVNLFDTADGYGMGVSESLLGKALRGRRAGVYIATKAGMWGKRLGDPLQYKSIYSIVECCHASLYRLGTDYIDLYQCHQGKPDNPEIFLEAFEKLKEEGKIRHYAISTNDVDAVRALDANGGCASCQINYSILSREAEEAILPHCRRQNIGVLLRGPLAKGLLTGKFTPESRFDDSVRNGMNDGKGRETFLEALRTVERLKPLARDGRTLAEVALRFVLAHPAVTCPIPGMKSPEQARMNAQAADGELTEEDLAFIDAVAPPRGSRTA